MQLPSSSKVPLVAAAPWQLAVEAQALQRIASSLARACLVHLSSLVHWNQV